MIRVLAHALTTHVLRFLTVSNIVSISFTLCRTSSLLILSSLVCQVYDTFNMSLSCLGVILQMRCRGGMYTPQLRMVRLHTQSHVVASVVSLCLPCSFRLPGCPPVVGPP